MRKSDIGARLVITVERVWNVGLVERRRESLKWEPRKNVEGESDTRTQGMEDYMLNRDGL